MSDLPRVDILLATCIHEDDDERITFLRKQLDSLITQDYPNFHILIRDDASKNPKTIEVIREYQERHPDLITLIDDDLGNVNYTANFEQLMLHSDAEYMSFCDQDDIWYPNKVSHSLEVLQRMETEQGKQTPLMMHHEARIINEFDDVYLDYMRDFFGEHQFDSSMKRTIQGSPVFGFTAMINRSLANKSLPFVEHANGHDGHIATIARAFGDILYDTTPLADYRIHSRNTSGMDLKARITSKTQPENSERNPKQRNIFSKLWQDFRKAARASLHLRKQVKYAEAFYQRYKDDPALKPEDKELIGDFISLGNFFMSPSARKKIIEKHGFFDGWKSAKRYASYIPLKLNLGFLF